MKVKYVSPAMPPVGIKVGILYTATTCTGIDEGNYIVEGIKFSKPIFDQMFEEIGIPEVEPIMPIIKDVLNENVNDVIQPEQIK